ncbi:MAG: tannase/feruloyl esterase family alpha/beta hydrolase, partial [Desulfobacterales bacterium]
SSTVVPAADGAPEYCRVLGYVRPAINFEIRLPTDWNGKFYMAGCGGYCGTLDSDRPGFINAMAYALPRGYAISTMDSGHWGSSVLDGRWAYHNPVAEVDWAYRAVHETQHATKAVIEAYYGKRPEKSYFQGCSTGGRMALMEAWRFPEDFDGIICGAPAMDYTGLVGTFFAWLVQANTNPEGKDIITPAKVDLIRKAVYERCDKLDGIADGVIDDPRKCDFDPASLRCPPGTSADDCLTEEMTNTLEAWYGGARDSAGKQLYPGGIPKGSEPYWWLWLTGNEKGGGRLIPLFSANFLSYMAFRDDPGPDYTPMDFDFDNDPEALEYMAAIYNSDNPDLSKFKEHGGKLLLWHGWADAIVTPQKTVDYYEEVLSKMGGESKTKEFFRLFMIPGVDHCGLLSGPGINQMGFDPLSALEAWVEKGTPPESLLATKKGTKDETLWTRPLCPYPQVAKYKGSGDINDAANFQCENP